MRISGVLAKALIESDSRTTIPRGLVAGVSVLFLMSVALGESATSKPAQTAAKGEQAPCGAEPCGRTMLVSASTPLPQKQLAAGAPRLRCDQPTFEFTEAWAGDKIEHMFVVRNDGDAVLLIKNVRPSCGCTLAGKYDESIEPGKEGKIPVALNTEHQQGAVNKQITVETNDNATPHLQLALKGAVKTVIALQPVTGASWGQYTPDLPDTMTVKLTNNLDQPWQLVFRPDPAQLHERDFDVVVQETEKGKKADVFVSLRKPVREGTNAARFRFTTGLPRGGDLIIPAVVYLRPALQVLPNAIVGTLIPGQDYQTNVQLVYSGEGEFNIESVTPSDPVIKAEVIPPAPAARGRYVINVLVPRDFVPKPDKPAAIEIKTNRKDRPDNGVVSVPVQLRVLATRPAAQNAESGQRSSQRGIPRAEPRRTVQ